MANYCRAVTKSLLGTSIHPLSSYIKPRVTPPSPLNPPIFVAWFSGVFLPSFLGVFCSTAWKTRHQNPPFDWGVGEGEGGRYACGLAWLIFTTAIVFWWFLQTYLTSGQCSCWFFLVMKQRIFWHYLGFQVMAILCWAAKNSLRGTRSYFKQKLFSKRSEPIRKKNCFHSETNMFVIIF